jgi:hypothetical protein
MRAQIPFTMRSYRAITTQFGEVFAGVRRQLRDELTPRMEARRTLDPVACER